MSLYVIALLLTNVCYWSLGLPLNDSYGPLAKSLKSLADHCENSFLSTLIKSKLDSCNIMTAGRSAEAELQCIMFYNINSQLCSAFRGSKFDLSPTYAAVINETQEVKTVCNVANTWKFAVMPEYPHYIDTFKKIFNPSDMLLCLKFCTEEGVLSKDTNFYCKHYKWGSDMLKLQITSTPPSGGMLAAGDSAPAVVESAPKTENNSLMPVTTKAESTPKTQAVNSKEAQQPAVNDETPVNLEEPAKSNGDIVVTATSSVKSNSQPISDNGESPIKLGETEKPVKQAEAAPEDSTPPKANLEKDKKVVATSLISNDNNEAENNPQLKAPSLDLDDGDDSDPGAYIDSEDNLPETQQANEGNDPVLESDPKLDEDKSKSIPKNAVGEFYSNTLQEGFPEDDDHFFPFFLTAIILAVLLYILYHNKSKFRKIFMGLLVEGRQSGRRRNSRGHAYRRLDTLEQAMSTNSAAPPSKIIY